jgi:2-oxo-3-hexenedioate decarboxylase
MATARYCNPLAAVAMLANHMGGRGREIPAGTFIMTGGVTEAIAVKAGDNVAVRFHELGTCRAVRLIPRVEARLR